MIKMFCDRCSVEVPYETDSKIFSINYENGKSYQIRIVVVQSPRSCLGRPAFCDACIMELLKKSTYLNSKLEEV